jgi:hypothetical protein
MPQRSTQPIEGPSPMPPSCARSLRLAVLTAAVAALTLGTAEPAAAAPNVTLVAPANGSTVTIKPGEFVTYQWQISWPDVPPQGLASTNLELSTTPSFGPGQLYGSWGESCRLPNYACWTTFAAPKGYGPPQGPPYGTTFYWRVVVNNVASAVGSFRVRLAPDVVKPRVRAYGGSARRGTRAHFMARVQDERGPVRYRATLEWRGIPVLGRMFPFLQTVWTAPLDFYSAQPLPRRMRPGRYQFCLTAWDQAANKARSCALYRIR